MKTRSPLALLTVPLTFGLLALCHAASASGHVDRNTLISIAVRNNFDARTASVSPSLVRPQQAQYDLVSRSFNPVTAQGKAGDIDFRRTEPGRGTFSYHGEDPLTEVSVTLRSNGEFEITFKGRSSRWVRGTYSGNGERLQLRITAVSWTRSANGDGFVVLSRDRNNFTTLSVLGTADRDRFTGNFVAGGGYAGGNIEFQRRQDGRGRFDLNGVDELDGASVDIDSNGHFEISFRGRSSRWVRGTWTNSGNRLNLRIDAASWSRSVSGTGTVSLTRDNRDFTYINVSGTSGRDRFAGTFTVGARPSGPSWSGGDDSVNSFRTTERGRGTFSFRGDDSLNEASVSVDRNGRFEITLKGSSSRWVRGTWTGSGNRLELRIESASWARSVSGDGFLTVVNNRHSFHKISIQGTADRERFTGSFGANAGG